MTDFEIAKTAEMIPIKQLLAKYKITDTYNYGDYIAKINPVVDETRFGKLIIVTATSPTKYGEGKSTVTIGLNDALNRLKVNSICCLREPSQGPVFGLKGGATGGGYAQVNPMKDINLHFTGDIHAISLANNLVSAAIDNHIHQGNELDFDLENIVFRRVMDLNDRSLRQVKVGLGPKVNGLERNDKFSITVASELMAILCLANNLQDFKTRVGKIILGYNTSKKAIYASDLGVVGAVSLIMFDSLKPNVVQTLENNLALIHGGPFANIAHGCNSVVATKTALTLGDYAVTEAGFGSDLGYEKFIDIKCRNANLQPNVAVLVTSVRALKFHGDNDLTQGFTNLQQHIDNIKDSGDNLVVAINKFGGDTDIELELITNYCEQQNIMSSVVTVYEHGGQGAIDLAQKVLKLSTKENNFKFKYQVHDSFETKVQNLCEKVYGVSGYQFSDELKQKIQNLNLDNYQVCIAKTPASFTDNPKLKGIHKDYIITFNDLKISNGAGFVVLFSGSVIDMPGLNKEPALLSMDIDEDGNVVGLF